MRTNNNPQSPPSTNSGPRVRILTQEIELRLLSDFGYGVIDQFYTARAIEQGTSELRRNLLKLPRKLLFAIHPDLAARIPGQWSLMVLAK